MEISAETIDEAARKAPPLPRRILAETFVAREVFQALAEPVYRHLFRGPGVQAAIARAVLAVELPPSLYDELFTMKLSDPARYAHALATAVVAVRMGLSAAGEARVLPDLAAAALLHDLGMRYVSAQIAACPDSLSPAELDDIAAHPLLGAYQLACSLGRHSAVQAALYHHWRRGFGYPRMQRPPPLTAEIVGVAGTFAALTQPRPFRSQPYDARGATDVLTLEGLTGAADSNAVQLLVHALRDAHGDPRNVQVGRGRSRELAAANRMANELR
jgi:HD-GYP domain-containing protein (c-di-GMP phosphodiesterase class II)